MPLYVSLSVFVGALVWAVVQGVLRPLLADPDPAGAPRGDAETPESAAAPLLAAFLAGFGGSGALVHASANVSPRSEVLLALATGLLFAGIVRAFTETFGRDDAA